MKARFLPVGEESYKYGNRKNQYKSYGFRMESELSS